MSWSLGLARRVTRTLLLSELCLAFLRQNFPAILSGIERTSCLTRVRHIGQQGRCLVAKGQAKVGSLVMEYSGVLSLRLLSMTYAHLCNMISGIAVCFELKMYLQES